MSPRLARTVAPIITIETRVEQHLSLKQQIDALEAERKEVGAEIQAELHKQGVESLVVGDHKVSLVTVEGRTTLDQMALLMAGVTSGQILAGQKQGSAYVKLDVRKVGKK